MRAAQIAFLAVFLLPGPVFAQTASNTVPVISFDSDLPSLRLTEDMILAPSPAEGFRIGKHFRIGGPLVAPLKAKKVWDFPLRLLRMLNPFAKSAASGQAADFGSVESRAWTTIVGWTPGQSPFPDDTHHESQLRLLSVSTGK